MNPSNSMNAITPKRNNPITILIVFLFCVATTPAHAELRTNMDADVVIGQPNFNSATANNGGIGANTVSAPARLWSTGEKLFISETNNKRCLIFNSIPTSNFAPADAVQGQVDFTTTNLAGASGGYGSDFGVCSDGKRLIHSNAGSNRVLIYDPIPTRNNTLPSVIVGQETLAGATGGTTQNKLSGNRGVASDGKRLFIADTGNHRVLIFNTIPTANLASADVVVGQADFISKLNPDPPGANTLNSPQSCFSDGKRLFIADSTNNRVLIFNSIPTTNKASADVVVGQPDFISKSAPNPPTANSLSTPEFAYSDGKRLFIADSNNHRVLVFNSIPTTNNASADVVIGQPGLTSNSINQGLGTKTPGANTIYYPRTVFSNGKALFVSDNGNQRVLIYNIGSSSVKLGPQFEQGKAVLGKVFNDINSNGWQDEGELGIEGVKVASDTGIYAITDSDGKYHFPYIETGQHLLKVDPVTLPEGATFTTDNPYKVTVTKGILTKVSFGVKLPDQVIASPEGVKQSQEGIASSPSAPRNDKLKNEPLLKVSIFQDPLLLKPKLSIQATKDKNNVIFNIDCNYFLFIEKSVLNIYDESYKKIKSIELPKPLPSKYTLPISELPLNAITFYYQLCVYDKQGNEDRTGVGEIKP